MGTQGRWAGAGWRAQHPITRPHATPRSRGAEHLPAAAPRPASAGVLCEGWSAGHPVPRARRSAQVTAGQQGTSYRTRGVGASAPPREASQGAQCPQPGTEGWSGRCSGRRSPPTRICKARGQPGPATFTSPITKVVKAKKRKYKNLCRQLRLPRGCNERAGCFCRLLVLLRSSLLGRAFAVTAGGPATATT